MGTKGHDAREVSAFWNRMAEGYNRENRNRGHHRIGAEILHENLSGSVLSVGGLWAEARLDGTRFDVTVLDISERMLEHYASRGVRTILGDARDMDVESGSYDHVVFPLMLHHLTGHGAGDSRLFVRQALAESKRVLKGEGTIWIKEIVVPTIVYGVELGLARVTKRVLRWRGVPLVILHSLRFWSDALERTGFVDVSLHPCDVSTGRWSDMIPPIIGLPSLKVPRFLVPVRNMMISGRTS
jgi:ubiquinone/menaquinone biosynthesis C-methylase UbiE